MKITQKLADNIRAAAFVLMIGGAMCVDGLVDSTVGMIVTAFLVMVVVALSILGTWLDRELTRQERRRGR